MNRTRRGEGHPVAQRRIDAFRRRSRLALSLAASALIVAGCSTAPSSLDPRGPAAAEIADLWWLMFWLAAVLFVATLAVLFYGLWRARRRQVDHPPPLSDRTLVVVGGVAIPAVALLIVLVFSVRTGTGLSPTANPSALTVEVIGHQFWWEVRYPEQEVVTANEIHIPVGTPVQLRLTSVDVIHSFWVPQLHGKMDLIPGKTNSFWIEAAEAGVYRGICAEFCGIQHARMQFLVLAEPADQFSEWLAAQQQPAMQASDPVLQRGLAVFFEADCAACHTIRGISMTEATGEVGPDLTHFGSRRTIAAATLENTRGNLGGWVLNPQEIKPGNRMPPTTLDTESFHALLTYLQSLK